MSKRKKRESIISMIGDDLGVTAIIVTLCFMLLTSWTHLASTFSRFYPGDGRVKVIMGGIAATAIDGTLFTLALSLGDLARTRRATKKGRWSRAAVYAGLIVLLLVSAAANLDAALTSLAGGVRPKSGTMHFGVDTLDIVRAVFGAATVPVMGAYLTHALSLVASERHAEFGETVPIRAGRSETKAQPSRDVSRANDRDGARVSHPVSFDPSKMRGPHRAMRAAVIANKGISTRALAVVAGYKSHQSVVRNLDRAGIYRDPHTGTLHARMAGELPGDDASPGDTGEAAKSVV